MFHRAEARALATHVAPGVACAEEELGQQLALVLKDGGSAHHQPVTREDARAWTACTELGAVALNDRCALSLVPLATDGADNTRAALPHGVTWAGRPYHGGCANLWANCVSPEPPPAADLASSGAGWRLRIGGHH